MSWSIIMNPVEISWLCKIVNDAVDENPKLFQELS